MQLQTNQARREVCASIKFPVVVSGARRYCWAVCTNQNIAGFYWVMFVVHVFRTYCPIIIITLTATCFVEMQIRYFFRAKA